MFQCTNCHCTEGALHCEDRVSRAVPHPGFQVNGGGDTLECVDKFCYLGDMIGSGSGAEEASRMRVKCA